MSNKDEALRAKDKAKDLMGQANFTAARIFAMKAQQMDASLENDVSRMIMVCDVHCAALDKSGDETDWYKILQVDQNADDNAIKTQYKKLALQVHPDKNFFPGADSACKIIGEAKSILLDKDKRRLHDIRRKPVSRRPAPAPSFKPQQAPTKEGTSETIVVSSGSECEEVSSCSESSEVSSCSESSEVSSCSESSEEVPQAEDQKKPQAQPTGFGGGSTKEGFRAKSSSSSAVNNSGKRKRKTTAAAEFSANGKKKGRGKHDAVKNPQRYLFNPKNPYFVQKYVSLLAITHYELKFGAPYSTVNYLLPGGKKEESSLGFHGGGPFFRGWRDICQKLNLKIGDFVVCEIVRSGDLVTDIRVHLVNE